MEQIEFGCIQRATSRIGLGCGRLVGGLSTRASRAIVETALEVGITHFDVAPSYGLGLAEDVLGDVLLGNKEVTLTTKVGIPRPSGGEMRAIVRKALRPLAAMAPKAKRLMLNKLRSTNEREQFDASSIERSLAESLDRLKRTKVDFLLLHEAPQGALTPELVELCSNLVSKGQIGAFGSGIGGLRRDLVEFGSVWQYRASPAHEPCPANVNQILHGIVRHGLDGIPDEAARRVDLSYRLGYDLKDKAALPGLLLTVAMAIQPDAVILISSNLPARIRSAVSSIDWDAAKNLDFLPAFAELQAACRLMSK